MDKAKVTMEIEIEELDLFMSSLQSGVTKFSEETGANVLKVKVVEE